MSHTITLSNTTPFVCAVTVAYNNPEELASLLSSLHDQHACLSGLIIIDNSDNCFSVQNKTICDLYARRYAFNLLITKLRTTSAPPEAFAAE